MKIISTPLNDCFLLEPKKYFDQRGHFFELFNNEQFSRLNKNEINFVQDNVSVSTQGVLRGLHYQLKKPQGKIVCVLSGEIFDVVVDLRVKSSTFGKWFGTSISEENGMQIWVPPGFAHGFLTISKKVTVFYKVTDFYAPNDQKCIFWNDTDLNINWPLEKINHETNLPILSESDKSGCEFLKAEYFHDPL